MNDMKTPAPPLAATTTTTVEVMSPPPVAARSGRRPFDSFRFSSDSHDSIDEKKHKRITERSRHLTPSQRLTAHQKFYIFVLDGLGGMMISAGVNFAIAYGTFLTFLTYTPAYTKPQDGGNHGWKNDD